MCDPSTVLAIIIMLQISLLYVYVDMQQQKISVITISSEKPVHPICRQYFKCNEGEETVVSKTGY